MGGREKNGNLTEGLACSRYTVSMSVITTMISLILLMHAN
jgi:hypothetical protein